jgi:hypothetical protein
LGELLSERQQPAARTGSSTGPVKDTADLGPGLRVLAYQRNGLGAASQVPAQGVLAARSPLTVSSLLGADLLLVGMLVLWRRHAVGSMGLVEAAGCVLVIAFGAWLAGLAVWLHFKS